MGRAGPVAALGAVAAWLVLLSRAAWAHPVVVRTDPGPLCPPAAVDDRCRLSLPPSAVRLSFSEPVRPLGPGLTVRSPSGRPAQLGRARAAGNALEVAVDAAEPGTYVVTWQVVGDDGHPAAGRLAFSVGHPSPVPSLMPLGTGLAVGAEALRFAGYALVFGPQALAAWVGVPPPWRLVALGVGLRLAAEPLALAADLLPGAGLLDVADSPAGRLLGLRAGFALFLWAIAAVRPEARRWLGLALAGAALDAASGHPFAPAGLSLAVHALHLAAMGVWVGGLAAFLAGGGVVPGSLPPDGPRRFARMAGVAAAVLAGTGAILAAAHLRRPQDLLAPYGHTLTLKLVAAATAFALARAGARGRPGLWRWEAVLLGVALVLAARLVSLPPPR